jgi:hypothetical protein
MVDPLNTIFEIRAVDTFFCFLLFLVRESNLEKGSFVTGRSSLKNWIIFITGSSTSTEPQAMAALDMMCLLYSGDGSRSSM